MAYTDNDREPIVCDECGRTYYYGKCRGCAADYAAGVEDAERYHTELAIGGEAYAAAEELRREYGAGVV